MSSIKVSRKKRSLRSMVYSLQCLLQTGKDQTLLYLGYKHLAKDTLVCSNSYMKGKCLINFELNSINITWHTQNLYTLIFSQIFNIIIDSDVNATSKDLASRNFKYKLI